MPAGIWSTLIVFGALGLNAAPDGPAADPSPTPLPAETAAPAPAPTTEPRPEPTAAPPLSMDTGVQVHGFVSPGFIVTTHSVDYLARTADRGSFEFAEAGINFTRPITDRLRVGMQLFTRDLGPIGDYEQSADWFYLDYHWRDWLGIRAGRVKLPFGLYNTFNDVDAGRVPILLPQSVYPITSRDLLLAQTGGEIYGFRRLPVIGAVEYRAYYGTIFLDTSNPDPASPTHLRELTVPYIGGGRVLVEPIEGLRFGASVQSLRLDAELLVEQPDPAPPAPVSIEIPALLWVASAEYVRGDLLLATEYSRWRVESRSSNTSLFPESDVTSERAYAMASYRVADWFHPGVYHSMYFPNIDQREFPEQWQHDTALTLRFDLTPNWLVKLEGHYMNGTASLNRRLNPEPVEELPESWAVFLVKTTAHF